MIQTLLKVFACSLCILSTQLPIGAQPSSTDSGQSVHAKKLPARNISEWNISKKKLAASGYDVVAYFPEGGSTPRKGKKKIHSTYRGVVYRFSSEEHKAIFEKNPYRYEPAYGGWCAWAMSKGSKTEINPKTFIVKNDRLFLFYNGLFGNTKTDWKKGDHLSLMTLADMEWNSISKENPPEPASVKKPESP